MYLHLIKAAEELRLVQSNLGEWDNALYQEIDNLIDTITDIAKEIKGE